MTCFANLVGFVLQMQAKWFSLPHVQHFLFFVSLWSTSLCEGIFHHSSYIFRLFHHAFKTDKGCVTHGDFACGAVCPSLMLVSPFSVVLLPSPDFRTTLLVFRLV